MNPEEFTPPEEALLGSLESAVSFHFPDFSPDRSRLDQPSSDGTRLLEFHTPEGNSHDDPIIYLSIQSDPTTCSAYAQHITPPEGKISLIGAPAHEFEREKDNVFWNPADVHIMLSKLRVFTEGIELNDTFLDQLGTWSPKLGRFLTIRERLLSAKDLKDVETEPDSIETIDWNEADNKQRAIYKEEQRLILEQKYTQTLNGLSIQTLATRHPGMAQVLVERNIQQRGSIISPTGETIPSETALFEIRGDSTLGTQLLRMELHRLDAVEQILRIKKPTLPQQSSELTV